MSTIPSDVPKPNIVELCLSMPNKIQLALNNSDYNCPIGDTSSKTHQYSIYKTVVRLVL